MRRKSQVVGLPRLMLTETWAANELLRVVKGIECGVKNQYHIKWKANAAYVLSLPFATANWEEYTSCMSHI
ncbi:hypothetical protein BDQ17DRAFT_1373652 [Cyathus striatus]|nr:hypothetical protein BDQ17DRAFT_1373652 [Cyathus striatus]